MEDALTPTHYITEHGVVYPIENAKKCKRINTKTKEITAKQYAKYKGCSEQNVTKKVRNYFNGKPLRLDNVYSIKRYSRFYTLEVPMSLLIPEQ